MMDNTESLRQRKQFYDDEMDYKREPKFEKNERRKRAYSGSLCSERRQKFLESENLNGSVLKVSHQPVSNSSPSRCAKLRQTFLIVDRVPQYHYEQVNNNYSAEVDGSVQAGLNRIFNYRISKSIPTEACMSGPVTSDDSGVSNAEPHSDVVSIISRTIAISGIANDTEDNLSDGISNNLSNKAGTVSPRSRHYSSSRKAEGTRNAGVTVTVSAAMTEGIIITNNGSQEHLNSPLLDGNISPSMSESYPWTQASNVAAPSASANFSPKKHSSNSMTHSAIPAGSLCNTSNSSLGVNSSLFGVDVRTSPIPKQSGSGISSPRTHVAKVPLNTSISNSSLSAAKNAMVLMMVYGNKEQCARVGCGPRWVPRSQITDEDTASYKMMDKDGTLDISFDEWRDYLLFHPSANLQDIIHYWRHATNLDVGEDLSVPDDFSPEEWVSGKWWRHLVAGGVAGMVSRTCTAPLDRLKVFLQVHGAHKYKSLRGCIKYMIEEGGVKSLWRGNGVNVLKIAPESALKFAAYEQAKSFVMSTVGQADRELSMVDRFAAGSFAGGFSQSVIYPMEVLKTRLALRKSGQYRGIADAARQIYRTEGLRSFYRGYMPNLLGIIPYAGIDLAVYETLKRRYALSSGEDHKDPSIMVIIGCGALSSSCGQLASYPLALIRTRLQAQVLSKGEPRNPGRPTTSVGIFKEIIRKEGPLGLYRGIAPNFMKVAPAVSISYVCYEKCREALGVRMT